MTETPGKYFKPCPKPEKRVKLSGKAKKTLQEQVYTRDKGKCVACGDNVPVGTIPHHIAYKSEGGSDTLENECLLCDGCHWEIHHGSLKRMVQELLRR